MHPRRSLFFVAPATPAGSTAFSGSPVHRPSDISSGANQAPRPCFSRITSLETRITDFIAAGLRVFAAGLRVFAAGLRFFPNLYGSSAPQFFGIPHNSSEFFGYPQAAVRSPSAPAKRLFGFSAFHESRNMVFPCSYGSSKESNHKPDQRVFHESRITAFTLFSLLSCALWRGMGRLWRGMGGHRPPHRQHGLIAVRTAVPAARSRLPCSRLFAIVRHCSLLI